MSEVGMYSSNQMKYVAFIASVVWHPLFALTYMLLILLVTNPYMFGYSSPAEADTLILMVFLTSAFIPIIATILLRALGWVRTFYMSDKNERIGPYIITGVLYLSLYMHMVKSNAFPEAFRACTLGVLIALFFAFFVNNFYKISVHAVAMGGLVSMVVLTRLFYSSSDFTVTSGTTEITISTMYLVYAMIIFAGLVCTSRLFLKEHTPRDIYAGFSAGFISQLIGYLIVI